MALLSIKAEKMEKLQGYQEGEYTVIIDSIESGVSKSGKPSLNFELRGEGLGTYTHRVYDSVFGRADMYKILTALGIDPTRDDVDSDELLGRFIKIKLEKDKDANGEVKMYNDKPQWRVTEITSAGDIEDDEDDLDDWDA